MHHLAPEDEDNDERAAVVTMVTIGKKDASPAAAAGSGVPAVGKEGGSGCAAWLSQQLKELRQSSSAKQIVVGAASGWASGFVCGRFGRTAATAVGGSVLALHLAQQYGYITINWNRVEGDVAKARKELEKKAREEAPEVVRQVRQFILENVLLASGFGGGFLLGIASS